MRANELLCEALEEIEFVCVNNSFPDATKQHQQDTLYGALHDIHGLIVYVQDWGDHKSMAVIMIDPSTKPKIEKLAQKYGVEIDLVQDISDKFIGSIYSQKLEGLERWYES